MLSFCYLPASCQPPVFTNKVTSSRYQVVQLSDTCIFKSSCPDENTQLGYQRSLVPWTGGWLEFTLLEVCLLSC